MPTEHDRVRTTKLYLNPTSVVSVDTTRKLGISRYRHPTKFTKKRTNRTRIYELSSEKFPIGRIREHKP